MTANYPTRCLKCKQKAVEPATIPFETKVKHENTLHPVFVRDLPCEKCMQCGFVLVDEIADAVVHETLRAQLRLLSPATMTKCRSELKVSKKRLAELCGFAPESVSRWEGGALQSRSTDRLLRVYFGVPQARVFLERLETNAELGASVIWHVGSQEVYLSGDGPQRELVATREHGPEPPILGATFMFQNSLQMVER